MRRAGGALLLGAAASLGCGAHRSTERVFDGHAVVGPYIEPEAYAAFADGVYREAHGDTAGALRACEAELRGQPEPFWLAGRLASQVSRTRAVQRLVEEGVPLAEIGKRLGLRFPPRREAGAASSYSADELEAAVVRIAALDHAVKGGSRLDPVLELERAIVEITETPDPHGR